MKGKRDVVVRKWAKSCRNPTECPNYSTHGSSRVSMLLGSALLAASHFYM
jgi:hypothetical protein